MHMARRGSLRFLGPLAPADTAQHDYAALGTHEGASSELANDVPQAELTGSDTLSDRQSSV